MPAIPLNFRRVAKVSSLKLPNASKVEVSDTTDDAMKAIAGIQIIHPTSEI